MPAGELLRSMGAGVVRFDHLDRADVARLGGRPRAVRPSWLIEVPHGFDTYAAVQCSAHKRFASQLRKHRKLHREHEVVVVTDDRDPRSVELLRRWKSAQYRRTSRRDRFAVPWIDRLVRDLLVRHDGHVRAELASLRVDGQVVAVHLGLRRGGRLVSWFPAYDPAAAALSPGSALFFSLAATHGNRIIDLGKGDEAFKQAMANATETVAEVDLWRPSPAALGHAAVRLPPSLAERAVLSSPPARRAARSALLAVGRLRSARGDGRPYDQGQPPSPTGL
ncbi:MAG TPA: GNAT family N-acetyltransferase [Acidimicrobiales bacterium]|nr:GNAT family N-acetyltransferase [Acidimicrobiales bacterium]